MPLKLVHGACDLSLSAHSAAELARELTMARGYTTLLTEIIRDGLWEAQDKREREFWIREIGRVNEDLRDRLLGLIESVERAGHV